MGGLLVGWADRFGWHIPCESMETESLVPMRCGFSTPMRQLMTADAIMTHTRRRRASHRRTGLSLW